VESLFSRASALDVVQCALPSGERVALRRLTIRFGRASPDRLPEGSLPPTYTVKPLVTFHGAAMFGELAVLRWLEVDGWEGVWLDTFHARRAWREMPSRAVPVALPAPAQALYDAIVDANGGRAGGTFDVMAWRGAHTIFVEYKDPRDRPNRNESRWIAAAISAGVSPNDLLIVVSADAE
jgi:hypothetical protein